MLSAAAADTEGAPPALAAAAALPRLRVSDNGRFLVRQGGSPFFYMGDTAWWMVTKGRREDASDQPGVYRYFEARGQHEFNVLQTVAVRFAAGGAQANVYGQLPYVGGDVTRPRVVAGADNDYWDFLDHVVGLAASHGMYVSLLPTWQNDLEDSNPIVRDPSVAYRFGHFLGSRYPAATSNVIWVLGGDPYRTGRDVDNPVRLSMTRAIAEGLADGAGGVDRFDGTADWSDALMTYHPQAYGHSSSEFLHSDPWLDFNMIHTTTYFAFANYPLVSSDYAKAPAKPTFDGEVAYENSLSLRSGEPQDVRISPWDTRRGAYWNVFAGGFGHAYGHRSFIRWTRLGQTDVFGADTPWFNHLQATAATQMKHLKRLIESRPFLNRVPDQSVISGDAGTGNNHARATRASDGSYAFVYLPRGRAVTVRMDRIAGGSVRATWYDPKTGTSRAAGTFANTGTRTFTPATTGDGNDWVLVLDNPSLGFPDPGVGTSPMVTAAVFDYASPGHAVRITFNTDVSASLAREDLSLVNLTTGAAVSPSWTALNFDPVSRTAVWTFPGVPGARLADANYRVTLAAGSVTDPSLNPLPAPFTSTIFALAADVNRDRAVDAADFATLANNFGKSGVPYAGGDLNGDGRVDAADFNLLASRFGRRLAIPV